MMRCAWPGWPELMAWSVIETSQHGVLLLCISDLCDARLVSHSFISVNPNFITTSEEITCARPGQWPRAPPPLKPAGGPECR